MPRTDPAQVTQHLDSEQRAARIAYLAAHPDVDERDLVPTTAGYAPVQDWLDSLAAKEPVPFGTEEPGGALFDQEEQQEPVPFGTEEPVEAAVA